MRAQRARLQEQPTTRTAWKPSLQKDRSSQQPQQPNSPRLNEPGYRNSLPRGRRGSRPSKKTEAANSRSSQTAPVLNGPADNASTPRLQPTKIAALRPLFVSSCNLDYLLSLRRSASAKAPRPNRPIVAGSGTGVVGTMVPSIVNAAIGVADGRLSKRAQALLPLAVPP